MIALNYKINKFILKIFILNQKIVLKLKNLSTNSTKRVLVRAKNEFENWVCYVLWVFVMFMSLKIEFVKTHKFEYKLEIMSTTSNFLF